MNGWLTNAAITLHEWQSPIQKVRRPRSCRRRFKQRLYWRDKGLCAYCEQPVPFDQSTIDHVRPLVRGGKLTQKENAVIACKACNNTKGPEDATDCLDLQPYALAAKWDELQRQPSKKGRFNEFVR